MTGMTGTPLSLTHGPNARILIIDDEPNVLSVLYSLLSKSHDCKTATSAIEAMEYLKHQSYDLVLSDIMMPGMTGIECIRIVKPLCPSCQFMMFTVYEEDEKVFEALKAGASGYMLKKHGPQKIIEALRNEISQLRSRSVSGATVSNVSLEEIARIEKQIRDIEAELEQSFTVDSVPLSRLLQLRTKQADLKSYLRGLKFCGTKSSCESNSTEPHSLRP